MTDKLISDLGSIGAVIADNTATEVQRSGQTTTEQALGSDWKTYIKSWIAKADVGLGNVANSLQLVAASNLSDLANLVTARNNLGYNAAPRRAYRSGRWYMPRGMTPSGTNFNNNLTARLTPFFVEAPCTITDLGISITTVSSGQNLQLAIYAADASTDAPTGTPLATTGNISTTSSGRQSGALGSSLAITTPGLYWLGVEMSDATMQITSPATANYASDIGNSTLGNAWQLGGLLNSGLSYSASTFGTWPDLTAASPVGATNATPCFEFKVS